MKAIALMACPGTLTIEQPTTAALHIAPHNTKVGWKIGGDVTGGDQR
jgi:hypothetical protein